MQTLHTGKTLDARESQGASTVALDRLDRDAIKRAVGDHEAIVNLATAIPRSTLAMFFPSAWKENDRILLDV